LALFGPLLAGIAADSEEATSNPLHLSSKGVRIIRKNIFAKEA
jgi:hypothetical protein